MGVVYEAYDSDRRSNVALKTLSRFDGDALARFKREFRALQGLSHPNLVVLDELFFESDQWFFTMELLDGVDFVSYVRQTVLRSALASTIHAFDQRAYEEPVAPESALASHPRVAATIASFDEGKLRDALRQLLEGLSALHAAEKVHRDIKPSNVLVTREGRVVVLDFGLVTEASVDDRSTGHAVVGTPAYMAPEQAASRDVGPAADLYAVGVMLYELLTGRLPIDGAQLQILLAKQTQEPVPPASIAPDTPDDLNTLCMKLLQFDPAARPTAAEVLRSLALPSHGRTTPRRTSSDAPTFVGRDVELAQLRAAFEATRDGRLGTALVCGESGIGKSYMVRRFTAQLLGDRPDAVLLEGRCYERETVPYKTLDGIADALSRRLARMSEDDVAVLLPTRCAMLAQLFPVMLHVPQIAREHAAMALHLEAHELRKRAFAALRDLFTRIAARSPTVIVIDDLQWADDDGLRALAEILQPPDAPPLLLVGTVRTTPGRGEQELARVRAAIPGEPKVVSLESLGHQEARDLAAALLRRSDAKSLDADAIASEAGGHPLFIEELARHVALGGSAIEDGPTPLRTPYHDGASTTGPRSGLNQRVRLDDAIWSRIVQLEPATREMAELVAVAGKPVPQEVVGAAARVEPGEFTRRAAALRVGNLVKTSGTRRVDAIEPYHDRVREAVLAQLEPERRRALHEALAIAFEASSHDDAETLATHWREAGNGARAAKYASAAGDEALKAFAFDRAAQWYELALGLSPAGPGLRELRVKLGDALASAGRGALAATQFETAAAESPPMEALELRRRTAEELLRSGHFDRGMRAIRIVLAAIGMRVPSTRLGTFLALLYYRLRLRVRGLKFREREKGQITSEQLTKVDTAYSLAATLGMADHAVGMVFSTRTLLLALEIGEIHRIIRSFCVEASATAAPGGPRAAAAAQKYIQRTRELMERVGTPEARAHVAASACMSHYANGRFRDMIEEFRRMVDHIRSGSSGMVYEESAVRWFATSALAFLGRFKDLRREQALGYRDAVARGDVFASVSMRIGSAVHIWLAEDRPEAAETNTRAAMAEWSKRGFHFEHYHGLVAQSYIRLYSGDAQGAYASASELLEKTRGSLLWFIELARSCALHLSAAMALGVLERCPRDTVDERALLRVVEKGAQGIARRGGTWAQPFAMVLRAGAALQTGKEEDAIAQAEEAIRAFEAVDLTGYANAARLQLARLKNEAGAADLARATQYFRAEEIVAPEKMSRMLVPGLTRAARPA